VPAGLSRYRNPRWTALEASAQCTVIGNTATHNTEFGIVADCPSNLTDNTAVNNGTNLVLNGDGCHSEDNVAP
jgi:parallel beta-helix repeat protein